ncbi:HNH endonuclease signature motif containing protein [Orientia tsutsugamushi]|uniref:HNH endonuclease signature motif containing protein n=1 Tax=Orientia tsutsugamushi TaxID=784 RepID=UPI0011D0846F
MYYLFFLCLNLIVNDYKCPNCKQIIILETDFDTHYIILKSKGGNNRNSNLMLLHINYNKQIHNLIFNVEASSK